MHSLAIRSDLMVDHARQELVDHGAFYHLRTPEQPEYWFGNCLIFKTYDPDLRAAVDLHRAVMPDMNHICIQWDLPGLTATPEMQAMVDQGYELSDTDTLALDGDLVRFDPPAGITIRQIDTEWDQVSALQIETWLEEKSYDPVLYTKFVRDRVIRHQNASADGRCAWFGAFDGDLLVADMGVYVGQGIARWQSVETRAGYRRRGLCRALVGRCYDWAMARDPAAVPVIVADRNGAPGRTYRACGFSLRETMLALCKPTY